MTRTNLKLDALSLAKRARLVMSALMLTVVGAGTSLLGVGGASATTPSGGGGSLGLFPTKVSYSQALRGGSYTETIGLINGGSTPKTFYFASDGRAGAWLSVVRSSAPTKALRSVLADPGDTDLLLRLRVPATLSNGTYQGRLVVEAPPVKAANGTSSVGFGAVVPVTVHVTGTQILAGRLLDAYTYPKVEVGSPVTVFARVHDAGNVAITPVFHLLITKAKTVVFNRTTSAGTLQPSGLRVLQLDWPGNDTETQTLGVYHAELSASFRSVNLGSKSMSFRLVPYGSLHRGGKLLGLKLLNHPSAGYSAELQASVRSSGLLPQETTFVGQLYRNGALVQGVKSLAPVLLQPSQSGVINIPVPVAKDGLYRITGVATFDGAQSKTETLTFRVGPAPLPLLYPFAGGAAVLVLFGLLVLFALRRRRRRPPAALPPTRHLPPRYPATHPRTLHVPPRTPAASVPGRQHTRQRRG